MSRSSRTSELLSELAGTIRDRAAMRLRVEADRSGQRSEARFIIAFSAVAITGVLIFGRDSEFLDAYDDASGQLVFGFVVACFALGGWWMARLTRFERPARFLSISEERVMLLVDRRGLCVRRRAVDRRLRHLARAAEAGRGPRRAQRGVAWPAGVRVGRRAAAVGLTLDGTLAGQAIEGEHACRRADGLGSGARRPAARGLRRIRGVDHLVRRATRPDRCGASLPSPGTRLPMVVPLWGMLFGAAVGWFLPRLLLRSEAATARTDFRHALGAYLDVLVLLLAAQEGPESAMDLAAQAGQGPAFAELRRAVWQARLAGEPVWDTLDDLGRRLRIAELREVAAAGSLAGESGAAVRQSLTAKARSLRQAALAEAETTARKKSQALFGPLVLMGLGFVIFLIYPMLTNLSFGG